jgi:hypothetical protein
MRAVVVPEEVGASAKWEVNHKAETKIPGLRCVNKSRVTIATFHWQSERHTPTRQHHICILGRIYAQKVGGRLWHAKG